MKKINYNIYSSLLSMILAWGLGYMCHVVYQILFLGKGRIEDASFILIWSAIFCFVSSILIVPIIVWLTNKFKKSFLFFVLFSLLASFLIMLILPFILFGFYFSDMGGYFYAYASTVSLLFSLIYITINIKKNKNK